MLRNNRDQWLRRVSSLVFFRVLLLFDVTTLKMARTPVKLQKENRAGCAGKVNRVKENRRREKDVLKITGNSIM